MVTQFPDTVIFRVPGTITIVDYVPVQGADVDYSVSAEVQPGSNSVKIAPDGTQIIHAFDVFVPLSADIDNLKLATKVVIDGIESRVIQSYSTKSIVAFEFIAGKSSV